MEFSFQKQHLGRLPDHTKILFLWQLRWIEFKLISLEKVSDHFVKYWICNRVNPFSFTFVDALTVANSVFTIFQVISATDQFERGPRRGTSNPSLGEEKTRTNVSDLVPHHGNLRFPSILETWRFVAQDASSSPAVSTGLRAPARPPAVGKIAHQRLLKDKSNSRFSNSGASD